MREIEDLKDRLDCEHQITEAIGANLKWYKERNKQLIDKCSTLEDCQQSVWNDYWEAVSETNNQLNKVQKLKRKNQSLSDKNKSLERKIKRLETFDVNDLDFLKIM